jgi:hypothetical protein
MTETQKITGAMTVREAMKRHPLAVKIFDFWKLLKFLKRERRSDIMREDS